MRRCKSYAQGFTLLEAMVLLVVLSVIALAAGVGKSQATPVTRSFNATFRNL